MSNISTQAVNRQIKVPFHGAKLYVIEHGGQPYTAMKPIVEGIGVSWQGQHAKLAANGARWGIKNILMPSAGGSQETVCLPLRKLPGWLMTMEPNKVKDLEVRGRIVQYQNECDDVLWQYWNDGIAVNPRMAFSVNPGDVLTADQQETLRLMVKTLVERLPKAKQGGAATRVWSKLKAHFKVPYRQIPQFEFTEAVSIVTRTAAEWEVVDPEPEPALDTRSFALDDCVQLLHDWYLGGRVPNRCEIELARIVLMATRSAVKEAKLQLLAVTARNKRQAQNLAAAQKLLSLRNLSAEIPSWYRSVELRRPALH